jgi:uncharacterized protein (TIGR02145 family)
MMLKSGSSINVDLGIGGVYFVKLVSATGSKTFKAIGALNSGLLGTSIQDNNSNITGSFKSSFHLSVSDFSFNEGDSLRVSVYKNEYYSRPKVFEIVESDRVAFVFDVSDVETFGTSDGYVALSEEIQDVLVYEPTSGQVQITSANQELEINPGDIITVDVDTTGFLRKVVKVEDENGIITLKTEQAYLNDVFVNTNLKLNTEYREPQVSLKSASTLQIINALTDNKGYIHPVEVIYYDKLGKIAKKSAIGNSEAGEESVNIIDFYNDFAGTDLYGKASDDVHFYIEEGHASVVSNAVFELDFGFDGGITEDTKVKKGDIKSFDFYLDTEADFQTKLVLDMNKSYEKEDAKTIFDFRKVTAKFIVPPGIPVWITFDCDIFGNYHLAADAMLHADWGFESNHILKVGAHYDRATNLFTPIKEYDPTNTIYPLNIQGELNAMARLELYPRIDIKFYSFFGPYAEIVPYILGNYNAALQSQITPSGSETFLAWNSGIDLGLDFRIGAELTFLGLFEKEFGPEVVNCFETPLWSSPENIELASTLPAEVDAGSTQSLIFRVTDLLGLPVSLCPVYIEGDGEFNKNIGFTDAQGELSIDWTLGIISGNSSFSATIFNSDKTIIKTIEKTICVAIIAPVADYSASATEIIEGETIQFTDLSTNEPTEWSWNFGDGGSSTQQNPSHTYTTAGTYHITLTVTNEADSDTEIKSGYITVTAAVIAPVADFSASATEIVEGETIQFTDLSTNEPTEWSWNFGDGGSSTQQNPSHTYTTAGTYHITLTVTNEADSDTEIKTGYITVTAAVIAPVADFSASATEIVEGETIQFTDLSTNEPTEWSWNFGDGGSSTQQNPSHTYTTAGTYHITLTVTNEADSDTEIKSGYITVTAAVIAPVADFSASATEIVEGETIQFTDLSTNEPTEWLWNFGDGGTGHEQNPSHTYTIAGTYNITLTVTNEADSDTEIKSSYILVNTQYESGILTDSRDGNIYNTVKIGNQWWMAENLKYLPSVVGPGTGSKTTPYYYVYGYNGRVVADAKTTSNYTTYGVLYNWPAVNPSGVQGVCPTGWHLPSDAEWTELTDYLGGESGAGNKLKETGTTHWNSPRAGATNETGFTALPGGYRTSNRRFVDIRYTGSWRSATELNATDAWFRRMYGNNSFVFSFNHGKEEGYSVRCIRD